MSESKNSICAAYFFFPLPSQFEAINLCITDNPVAGTSPRQLHRFSRDSMGLFWLWEAGWWRRSKMPGRDHQDSCLKSRGKSATCPGRRWKRTLLRKRGRREVVLREVRWWRKSSLAEMGKSHVPAGERGTQKRRQAGRWMQRKCMRGRMVFVYGCASLWTGSLLQIKPSDVSWRNCSLAIQRWLMRAGSLLSGLMQDWNTWFVLITVLCSTQLGWFQAHVDVQAIPTTICPRRPSCLGSRHCLACVCTNPVSGGHSALTSLRGVAGTSYNITAVEEQCLVFQSSTWFVALQT